MFESFSKLYAKLPPQQHSHSYHSLHSSGSRTALELTAVDSCEQQERCSITTSLVKQLTSSSAERLLLRVPIGRVPSCLRLSTVSPLSTSSTPLSCRLSWRFSVCCFQMSSTTSSASLSQGSAGNAVATSVSQSQPLSPSSQSASVAPSASVGELQVEGWVKKYQTGDLLFDSARLPGALEELRLAEPALKVTNKGSVLNVARLLGMGRMDKVGKPSSVDRIAVVEAIRRRRKELESSLAESDEDEAGTHLGDEQRDDDDNKEEEQAAEGEPNTPPRSSVPIERERSSSPRRTPASRRSGRARPVNVEGGLTEDEQDAVLAALKVPHNKVPKDVLMGLSDTATRFYNDLRDHQRRSARSQPQVSFQQKPAAARSLRVTESVPTIVPPQSARVQSASSRFHSAPLPPVPSAASELFPSSYGETESDVESQSDSDTGEVRQPSHTTSQSQDELYRLLLRQGVAPDLAACTAFDVARGIVNRSSYEHYWSSQYEHSMGSKPLYYEGMLLSLILDHKDNPLIWQELAVRRWCTLQFAANKGGTAEAWEFGRGFLPMSASAGIPAHWMGALGKSAKRQSELNPRRFTSHYGRGRKGGVGGGGGSGKKRSESGANSSAEGKPATSGAAKGMQRRNSTSGAGSSQPGAAGAGSG